MVGKAVKVGTKLAVKQHTYLEELAELHKTTIGAILRVAVDRLLHDISFRRVHVRFPPDARLKGERRVDLQSVNRHATRSKR